MDTNAGVSRLRDAIGGKRDFVIRGGGIGPSVDVALALAVTNDYDSLG